MADTGSFDHQGLLNAFFHALMADRDAGTEHPEEHYQRRWPAISGEISTYFADLRRQAADIAGQRIGKFEIVREIGRGGQGIVYLARDERLGRNVALKILNVTASMDPDRRARFAVEAAATARLDFRGFRTLYDTGETGGLHWIAMQYVEGESLADLLRRATAARSRGVRAPPPLDCPENLIRFISATARLLAEAHERKIVHRDIKPGNILVRPDGSPVLLDFGIARILEGTGVAITATGQAPGTPDYRAPECAEHPSRVDGRSDLWSLGITLYECLYGVRPFHAKTIAERRRLMDIGALSFRGVSRTGAPRRIRNVLRLLLAPNPDRRYQSARVVADDLDALLINGPISATRRSPREYLACAFLRYRLPTAILASAMVTAVAVATALLVGQWQRDRAARIALARSVLSRVEDRILTERDAELVLFDFLRALRSVDGEREPLRDAIVVAQALRNRGAFRAAEIAAEAVLEQEPPADLRFAALEVAAASRLFHSDAPGARRIADRIPEVPGSAAMRETLAVVSGFVDAPIVAPFELTSGSDSLAVLAIPGRPTEIVQAEHADLDDAIRLRRWRPGSSAAEVVDLKVEVAGTRPVVPMGIRQLRDSDRGEPALFVTVHRRDHDAGVLVRISVDPSTGSFGRAETLAVCSRAPGMEFTIAKAPDSSGWLAAIASAGRREMEFVGPALSAPMRVPLPAGDNDVMATQALNLDLDPAPEFVIAIPGHHGPGLYVVNYDAESGTLPVVAPIVAGPVMWDFLDLGDDFLVSTGFAPPVKGLSADAHVPGLRVVSRDGSLGPLLWRLPDGFPRTSCLRKVLRARGGSGALIAEIRTWRDRPSSASNGNEGLHIVVIPTPPGSLDRYRPPASGGSVGSSLVGAPPPPTLDGWFSDHQILVDVADFDDDGDDELVTLSEGRIRVHGMSGAVQTKEPPGPQSILAERLGSVADTLLKTPVRREFVASMILELTRAGQAEVAAEIIKRWIPEIVGSGDDLPDWHAALARDLALVRGERIPAEPLRSDGFLSAPTRRELESIAGPEKADGWFDSMDQDPGLMVGPREIVSDEAGRLGARGRRGPFTKLSVRRESWLSDPTATPNPQLVLASRDAVWNGVDSFRLGFNLYLQHCDYSTAFEAVLAKRLPESATPGATLRMSVSHGRDGLLYDRDRSPIHLDAPSSGRFVASAADMVLGAWFDVELAYLAPLHIARLSLRRSGSGAEQPPEFLLFCGLPENFGTEALDHCLQFRLGGADLAPYVPDGPTPGVTAYVDDVRFDTWSWR